MKLQQLNSIKLEKNKQTSFSGYQDAYNNDGKPVHQFFAPPYDKTNYDMHLEFVSLKDVDGKWETDSTSVLKFEKSKELFRNNEPANFPKDVQGMLNNKQFGYRFVLTPKGAQDRKSYYNDPGMLTNDSIAGGKFNVIINGVGGVAKAGPMEHVLLDSFNVKEDAAKDFKARTHFNVAGGNIQGLIDKITKSNELDAYKLIMTTPLFGKDEISSHGYWTTNPFQISSLKGDLDGFKKLNVEMFNNGKQFVADGAFTSQGFESPFLQHALKWGADSPYYDWFKFDYTGSEEGSKISLGILPGLSDPHDKAAVKEQLSNISYRLANDPYSDNYDRTKPTFIQVYDNRLVSDKQLKDANSNNKLIKTYDIKNPEDHYDIYNHHGSVQPYAFEVALSDENRKQIKSLKGTLGKPLSEIKDYEGKLEFDNFAITHKARNGGGNFWDGQLDLVKLNLANPNVANAVGSTQAKNSLFNAASYWTKTTHDALLESLATNPASISKVAADNGIADITNIDLKKYANNLFKGDLNAAQFILNEVANFPLEAIEVAPNLTAVLGSEYITPSATKGNQLNAKRVDLLKDTPSRGVYKNVAVFVNDVLSKIDKNSPEDKKIFVGKDLTEYGKFIARIITPELTKYAFVKGMFPEQVKLGEDKISYSEKLKDKGILDLSIKETSCSGEALRLVKKLEAGTASLGASSDKIAKIFENKFAKADLNSFKLAQAVIEQSGAGLNWRFDAAKDVADLDKMKANPKAYTMDNAVSDMINFWKPFVSNIKKENPNALTIAEITDFAPLFALGQDDDVDVAGNVIKDSKWKYIGNKPELAERRFYEETGATSGSNYGHLFSIFPQLYGHCVEKGTNYDMDMKQLWEKTRDFLSSGTLPFVLNSHVFVDNHDKPRVLHGMALDMDLFLLGFTEDRHKKIAEKVVGKDVDLDSISSKAVAVADAYQTSFDKVIKNNTVKTKMNNAVVELTLGKRKGGDVLDKGRSEAFGFLPLEVTIYDVIERANLGLNPMEQKQFADGILADVSRVGREKLVNMHGVMSAITGIPTIYSGTEFSQTGYELPSKNVELGCRGITLHNRASEKNEFAKTRTDINAISGLHQSSKMSAISGGIPILLRYDEANKMFPLYHYNNKGSETISIFADTGANDKDEYNNRNRDNLQYAPVKTTPVKEVMLQTMPGQTEFTSMVEPGTEFGRKILKNGEFKDEGVKYVINDAGNLIAKDGGEIELSAGVNHFFRI